MPLNCYSTFLEYAATSLLFAGQSCHTVFKQWASINDRPTVPRSSAQRPGFPTLASGFRGALLPTRVSAGPVGDIVRMSPPGRAGAMLARSRGPRVPALRYLHTLRQDYWFD